MKADFDISVYLVIWYWFLPDPVRDIGLELRSPLAAELVEMSRQCTYVVCTESTDHGVTYAPNIEM